MFFFSFFFSSSSSFFSVLFYYIHVLRSAYNIVVLGRVCVASAGPICNTSSYDMIVYSRRRDDGEVENATAPVAHGLPEKHDAAGTEAQRPAGVAVRQAGR